MAGVEVSGGVADVVVWADEEETAGLQTEELGQAAADIEPMWGEIGAVVQAFLGGDDPMGFEPGAEVRGEIAGEVPGGGEGARAMGFSRGRQEEKVEAGGLDLAENGRAFAAGGDELGFGEAITGVKPGAAGPEMTGVEGDGALAVVDRDLRELAEDAVFEAGEVFEFRQEAVAEVLHDGIGGRGETDHVVGIGQDFLGDGAAFVLIGFE